MKTCVLEETWLDFTTFTITQGLKLGILLSAKMFSILAKEGTNRLSDVLPKGNQLYSIFLITANPVLDKTQHTNL
jgi:hypothetical protein